MGVLVDAMEVDDANEETKKAAALSVRGLAKNLPPNVLISLLSKLLVPVAPSASTGTRIGRGILLSAVLASNADVVSDPCLHKGVIGLVQSLLMTTNLLSVTLDSRP